MLRTRQRPLSVPARIRIDLVLRFEGHLDVEVVARLRTLHNAREGEGQDKSGTAKNASGARDPAAGHG